jgi:hypothetical protein
MMATTPTVGCRSSCGWCWEVAEDIDILVASSVIDRKAVNLMSRVDGKAGGGASCCLPSCNIVRARRGLVLVNSPVVSPTLGVDGGGGVRRLQDVGQDWAPF